MIAIVVPAATSTSARSSARWAPYRTERSLVVTAAVMAPRYRKRVRFSFAKRGARSYGETRSILSERHDG